MTDLIACLGTETKAWEYARRLIEGEAWGQVFLIADADAAGTDGKTGFKCKREVFFVTADTKLLLPQLTEQIRKMMDSKIADTEVALNLALGTGKEHMALISAVLKLGLGIRLVAYTPEGVREV
ncbi:hypothetical protein HYV82_06820 [Candidatus Woesearchaeota archaeon]|nr:hypothetical protein [Candidatus Woesearchaeota archaeon]